MANKQKTAEKGEADAPAEAKPVSARRAGASEAAAAAPAAAQSEAKPAAASGAAASASSGSRQGRAARSAGSAQPGQVKPTSKIRIKMIGSVIGCRDKQRDTVRGLGLRRMHQIVERLDTPEIRGMVKKVPHLVAIVD